MVANIAAYIFYLNLFPCLILFLVGVPANLLIIYYFSLYKKKRLLKSISVYDLLILQIAVTDLLTCLTRAASIIIISAVDSTSSHVSDFACRYLWSVPFAASDVSVCVLLVLSVDRYLRIARPFRKRFSKATIHIAFMITWLLSGLLCIYFYYWRAIDRRETGLCLGQGNPPISILAATIAVNFIGMFLIPVIGIISLFQRSSRILKHQSQFVDKAANSSSIRQQQQQISQTPNHNRIAMSTLRCLTIAMFITVALPKISLSFLHFSFLFGLDDETLAIFEACVTSIVFINSGINIFPYLYYIKDFRAFVRDLLWKAH